MGGPEGAMLTEPQSLRLPWAPASRAFPLRRVRIWKSEEVV